MTENPHSIPPRVAVREVHLEQLEHGLDDLQGYERALVVFRLRGTVVGQVQLPVIEGHIPLVRLRAALPTVAWSVWKLLVSPEPSPDYVLPSASVVICTRDRSEELELCLESLIPLLEMGHELLVVDNCPSDDRTARLVARYPAIRYILEPRPGAGHARNCGLLNATNEIVAYTDDDARVDPGWLPALLRNFSDPLVAMVTGITMPLELETKAQVWFERTNGFQRGFERRAFDSSNLNPLAAGVVGASVNLAIRRSVVEEIGLFDAALGPGTIAQCGEDHEYFYRALAHGYRIVYDPAALVWHRHRREWSALRHTIYAYGVGVFAWWMRALLLEGEWTVLKAGIQWFKRHHVHNLIQALRRRGGHIPLDLAWAEFRGALMGPGSYIRSRRQLRGQADVPEARFTHPRRAMAETAHAPDTTRVAEVQ